MHLLDVGEQTFLAVGWNDPPWVGGGQVGTRTLPQPVFIPAVAREVATDPAQGPQIADHCQKVIYRCMSFQE